MSDRTAVDTTALDQAAVTAFRLSGDVLATSSGTGPALARTASSLAGAMARTEVTSVRQAAGGLLGDLGQVLAQLATVLAAAAREYADAERSAVHGTSGHGTSGGEPAATRPGGAAQATPSGRWWAR
jgi:hypothetical protein